MTRDDIMKLLQECGYGTLMDYPIMTENMMRFAALVAAHEREECAKLCDELRDEDGFEPYGTECAAAIRARGDV